MSLISNCNTKCKDWKLKADSNGHAGKFINHPDNIPDIDLLPERTMKFIKNLKLTMVNWKINLKMLTVMGRL